MEEIKSRLNRSFATVFPHLAPEKIPGANMDNAGSWDSVAHMTLLTVVDEEFGIETDPEDAENLTSWQALFDHVSSRVSGAA